MVSCWISKTTYHVHQNHQWWLMGAMVASSCTCIKHHHTVCFDMLSCHWARKKSSWPYCKRFLTIPFLIAQELSRAFQSQLSLPKHMTRLVAKIMVTDLRCLDIRRINSWRLFRCASRRERKQEIGHCFMPVFYTNTVTYGCFCHFLCYLFFASPLLPPPFAAGSKLATCCQHVHHESFCICLRISAPLISVIEL